MLAQTTDHFKNMGTTVDYTKYSQHPDNKIAASVLTTSNILINAVNYWPEIFIQKTGRTTKIGNASPMVHAELSAIFKTAFINGHSLEGATLYVSDPLCPNCAKAVAEAGIKNIYIDNDGFNKDFAQRRGNHFENMSMRIFEQAGINLFKIDRAEKKIAAAIEAPQNYQPNEENPAFVSRTSQQMDTKEIWEQKIAESHAIYAQTPFALCLAENTEDEIFYIIAQPHPTIGYTTDTMGHSDNKYSFIIQPVNRLLMNAARHGLKIMPEYIYSSRTPTSREFVNMIGAGLTRITIGDKTKARDEHGLKALEQLQNANILNI